MLPDLYDFGCMLFFVLTEEPGEFSITRACPQQMCLHPSGSNRQSHRDESVISNSDKVAGSSAVQLVPLACGEAARSLAVLINITTKGTRMMSGR